MAKIGFDIQGGDGNEIEALNGLKNFINNSNQEDQIVVYLLDDFKYIDELKKLSNVELVFCTEKINHDDSVMVIRRKKDSTLIKSLQDLKDKKIDGLISSGPSGPLVSASYLILRPISDKLRPAFSATIVGFDGKIRFLLDVGANSDSTLDQMLGFAKMGNQYSKNILNVENPKVGLLNIGKESKKGSELYKQVHQELINSSYNFIGNIEPNLILDADYDVLVMDGFNGNILLKSYEGAFLALKNLMKEMSIDSKRVKYGLGIAKPLYDKFTNFTKNEYVGAAIVLGLNEIVIKVHGSADSVQFEAAFNILKTAIKNDLINKIKAE